MTPCTGAHVEACQHVRIAFMPSQPPAGGEGHFICLTPHERIETNDTPGLDKVCAHAATKAPHSACVLPPAASCCRHRPPNSPGSSGFAALQHIQWTSLTVYALQYRMSTGEPMMHLKLWVRTSLGISTGASTAQEGGLGSSQ